MSELPDVNRVVADLTFVKDAINQLPYEQRQRENVVKYLTLESERWNTINLEILTLAYMRFLDNAEGDVLDQIASRYFISRNGVSDDQLKGAIKLRALKQDNEGTREQIYKILETISGNTGTTHIYKRFPNYVEIEIPNECIVSPLIKELLESIFPINTNIVLGKFGSEKKPFGFGSVHINDHPQKLGTFESVNKTEKRNSISVILVSTEEELKRKEI